MSTRFPLTVLGVGITVAGLLTLGPLPSADAASRLEGVIRTLAADTTRHSGDVNRQVLVVGGRPYFLAGKQGRPNTRVSVAGAVTGSTVTASAITTLASVPSTLPSTGTTDVLVVLAYWTAPDAMTPDQARTEMFSDTSDWYRDASYGALGQTGDVTPWLRIAGPGSATTCYQDSGAIMDQAKAAAAADGYAVDDYANFVVYFPKCGGDAVGFAGWALVGSPGTWLNGYLDRRVATHEQGHNYGLLHSHSQMCDGGGLAGPCEFDEYGDEFDAMGASGYVGHFNASQKALLGWLSGRAVDLTDGGTTTLAPMAADGGSVHAAYITVPGSTRVYWLEYRQPTDFDASLPSWATDGVLVHVAGEGSGSTDSGASLIDVQGGPSIGVDSSTLRAGSTWSTPEGVTVHVGATSAAGASVTVTDGGATTTQESAPAITYDGWKGVVDPAASGGSYRYSSTAGQTAKLAFTGTSLTWVTRKGPKQGIAAVTIDGASKGTVDLYAATATPSSVTYSGLGSGAHTVVVRVTGTKREASNGLSVVVDAFTAGGTTAQDSGRAVTYTGWTGNASSLATDGLYRSSGVAGASASIAFTGTGISWITTVGPGWGKAEVLVDGVDQGVVDLYAPAATWQTAMTYDGLEPGPHTLTVRAVGARNPAATSNKVSVDAFTITP